MHILPFGSDIWGAPRRVVGKMPQVGKKHYSYSAKGKAAARAAAKKTGKKVTHSKKRK